MKKRQKKTVPPNSYDLILYKKAVPLIRKGEPASKISSAFKITEAAVEDMISVYQAFLKQPNKTIINSNYLDLMDYKRAVPLIKRGCERDELAAEMNIGKVAAKEMMHIYSRFVSSI